MGTLEIARNKDGSLVIGLSLFREKRYQQIASENENFYGHPYIDFIEMTRLAL